jgi:polyferredoxin
MNDLDKQNNKKIDWDKGIKRLTLFLSIVGALSSTIYLGVQPSNRAATFFFWELFPQNDFLLGFYLLFVAPIGGFLCVWMGYFFLRYICYPVLRYIIRGFIPS